MESVAGRGSRVAGRGLRFWTQDTIIVRGRREDDVIFPIIPGHPREAKEHQSVMPSQQVWNIVEQSSLTNDAASKEKINELYSEVADLYHEFRPRYPSSLIDVAIQSLRQRQDSKQQQRQSILEVGCGPGTLTLPLALLQFQITAMDPSSAMIRKARHVCQEHQKTVKFQ